MLTGYAMQFEVKDPKRPGKNQEIGQFRRIAVVEKTVHTQSGPIYLTTAILTSHGRRDTETFATPAEASEYALELAREAIENDLAPLGNMTIFTTPENQFHKVMQAHINTRYKHFEVYKDLTLNDDYLSAQLDRISTDLAPDTRPFAIALLLTGHINQATLDTLNGHPSPIVQQAVSDCVVHAATE